MRILITGSNGFIGKNLVEELKKIKDGENKTRSGLTITEIFEYNTNSGEEMLENYCSQADFIFHFAAVCRPKDITEYMTNNHALVNQLLENLRRYRNPCPIMFSSSIQASLIGRFYNSEYGKSKLVSEKILFQYSEETKSKVLVYRLPNLFGRGGRPNYNSVVATFCSAIANDQNYVIHGRDTELELLYIGDLISGLVDALEGREQHCEYDGLDYKLCRLGRYCCVPKTYKVTLGEIVDWLNYYKRVWPKIPDMEENSFEKKLLTTYLSYIP